jgi:antitoxin PrlF
MPCLRDREAERRNIAAGLPGRLILTTITLVRNTESTMTTEVTLTSKGQTTIPKPIRDRLGMKTGDRMSFTLMPDGVVVMRVKNKRVSALAGLLYKKGRKPLPVGLLSR